MKRGARVGIVVALAYAGLTTDALATPTARLVYLRTPEAESCPSEDAVRAAVAARLGYDPFRVASSSTILAEVDRQGGAFVARIKLVDEDNTVRGTRQHVHRGDCAGIIDAVALTISIAIDPDSATRPPGTPPPEPPAPEPVVEAPPPVVEAPVAIPDRIVAPPPRTLRQLAIRVEGIGYVGAAPAFSVGAQGGAELAVGRWSIALEGRVDLSASRELAHGVESTSYAGGAVVPCLDVSIFRACGVASVGRLAARTEGVTAPGDDATARIAFGPRVAIAIPIAQALSLVVSETLLVTSREERLTLAPAESYSLSRVALGTGIGLRASVF